MSTIRRLSATEWVPVSAIVRIVRTGDTSCEVHLTTGQVITISDRSVQTVVAYLGSGNPPIPPAES